MPEGAATESPPNAAARTVFLSYSRKDFAVVVDLYRILAGRVDLYPWLDLVELRGGDSWKPQILSAIDASAYFVLVVSRDSMRSPEVREEWLRARKGRVRIILLRIDTTKPPPELADCATYDIRRQFLQTARALSHDIAIDRPASRSPRLAGLPPLAVGLVIAGHLVLAGWFGYLTTIAWTAAVGRSFPVRLGWFAGFTFNFTPLGVRCVAYAAAASVAVQIYAVLCVVRRQIHAVRLIVGIATATLFVAVSDVYLIAVQNSLRVTVAFPAPGLWHHLLTQDVFIGISIATAALIWRHPDLVRRTSVGTTRRSDSIDGDLDDLSFIRRQAVEQWVDRVLPGWTNGQYVPSPGTVAISGDVRDDDLARTIEAFCGTLGLKRGDETDDPPDHLIILVGPRTNLEHPDSQAVASTTHTIFVLVDSAEIPADAKELRQAQWVDLRRQSVGAFRNLAQALLPFLSLSRLIPSPVAPSQFVSPRPVAYTLMMLVGQSAIALVLATIQIATPSASAWRVLAIGAPLASLTINACMAIALFRRWWTPCTFRCVTAAAALVSVATIVTILRNTGWSPLVIVATTLLLAIQLLIYAGCIAVTYSTWMSLARERGPLALSLAAIWPSAATGLFFLLVASAILLGFGPLGQF